MRYTHTQAVQEFRIDGYATNTVTNERFKIKSFGINSEGAVTLNSYEGEAHLMSSCVAGPSNKGLFKKKTGITKRIAHKAQILSTTMNINIDGALIVLKKQRKDRKTREKLTRQTKHANSVTYKRLNRKSGSYKPGSSSAASKASKK